MCALLQLEMSNGTASIENGLAVLQTFRHIIAIGFRNSCSGYVQNNNNNKKPPESRKWNRYLYTFIFQRIIYSFERE